MPQDKIHKLAALEIKDRKGRIWDQFLRLERWTQPLTIAWIVNLLSGLCILFIITHPKEKVREDVYRRPETPGEPAIALRDLVIPRDVPVNDEDALDQKRAEVEAQVRAVYDFDPTIPDTVKRQVRLFFSGFRDLYPPEVLPLHGPTALEAAPITVPSAFIDDKEQDLLRAAHVLLTTEQIKVLKAKAFAPELEAATLDLLDSVYFTRGGNQIYIVFNKNDFPRKERDQGIEAYRINAPEAPPLEIVNLDEVGDLSAAQNLIEKRAQEKLGVFDPLTRAVLTKIAKDLLQPNLHFNRDQTEEAKQMALAKLGIPQVTYKKDEVIVRKGQRLSPADMKKIGAIIAALKQTPGTRSFDSVALFVMVLFFLAVLPTFARRDIRKFRVTSKDLIFLAAVLVLSLAVLKSVNFWAESAQKNLQNAPEGLNFYYLIPLAGAAMLVRMVLNSEIALVFSLALSALGGAVAGNSLFFVIYTLVGSVVAAGEVRQCRQRSTILLAGVILGLCNVLLILLISVITSERLMYQTLLLNALFGLAGGVFISMVTAGMVPVAEFVFGYATDIKLLELLNQDHPLLKDLSMKAPGTHQHSLMVANLAEAAAKAIGANPLVARVSAMYHDIGKMNKPPYYAENQWDGQNIHDRLSPSMSTLIIHAHIKDGAELAERYKLPKVVVAAINQHHGQGLLRFFFEKAKELNASGVPIEETEFRYPGPKPQTRESAIIMLADVVESAARTVREPNPARLQGMVQKLINRFFTDGQLDECDLTLKDLHDIARSFNITLGAIYHHRPDYPLPVIKGGSAQKKKSEPDADLSNHKSSAKNQAEREPDPEDSENFLKRLGM